MVHAPEGLNKDFIGKIELFDWKNGIFREGEGEGREGGRGGGMLVIKLIQA